MKPASAAEHVDWQLRSSLYNYNVLEHITQSAY